MKSGTIYEGLLESMIDNHLNLLHVRKLPRDGKVATHMNILAADYLSVKVKDFAPRKGKFCNAIRSCISFNRMFTNKIAGFQTDTGISKSSGPAKERELQKWVPEGDEFSQSLDGALTH